MTAERAGLAEVPWRRDADELGAALARWAAATDRGVITDVRAPASGMANETVLFRLDGDPLVARLAPLPDSHPTFPTYDLDLQRRVMQLVQAHTSVPVPGVVHLEESTEWFGVPFLVIEAVDGVVPGDNPPYVFDGWLARASDAEQRRLEESSIRVLVELHQIEDDGDTTAFLQPSAPGDTALARQLAFQRAYYDWACEGTPVPVVERALDALGATTPKSDRTVLNWGDSRIGNIIYRDFEPVAVLDWEMATVGPAEVDLGWMTFFHAFFQGLAEQYGMPGVPDLLVRQRAVATYEAMAGHELLELGWFEALAALRFPIISIRTSIRSIAFGLQPPPDDPDDLILFLPLLQRLLDEL